MMTGLELLILGQVQGVWYRASAQIEAKKLGLTGWVQNERDGSVRIHVFGSEEKLASFKQWCWEGSRHSVVEEVIFKAIPYQAMSDFSIRRL